MSPLTRRTLLQRCLAATAGSAVAPLGLALAGKPAAACRGPVSGRGFGPLQPRLPVNAGALGRTVLGDLRRVPLLALPPGFAYRALSLTGERMDDGGRVPGAHDGMAIFAAGAYGLRLVRNHELVPGERRFGNRAGAQPGNGRLYDRFALPRGQGGGGTTTLDVDVEGRLRGHWCSLGGTVRNCAGGPTPWGAWLSCEENVDTPATARVLRQRHGYVFEVPAALEDGADPVPIVGMGRFMHEAVAVDPADGRCYQTEDAPDGCLYRYTPRLPPRRAGDLAAGGELHALALEADVPAACGDAALPAAPAGNVDTRRGVGAFLGQPLAVRWVPVTDPDPPRDSVRHEAARAGGALFARGEGAWFAEGRVYFVCTTGGDAGRGQVWALDPARDTLTLLLEAGAGGLPEHPDNITVGADGTLYLMEDGTGRDRVVGVSPGGTVFPFLANALRLGNRVDTSEFAGGCFSPDGRLFCVNSQGVGITFVVFRDDGEAIALED